MEFTGLSLGQLAALFGAAALAVTSLYLLKLRRRRVLVPYVGLWSQLLADKQATRLFSQLKRLWSLLLALALIALLVLALGDPRRSADSGALRHRVILIDAGITMQTREGAVDRLRIAVDHARAIVQSMGSADRILIAQVAAGVTPLSPMTDDALVLTRALERVQPTDVRTDLVAAMDLARDILRGRSQPEIILISDGASHPQGPLDAVPGIALQHVLIGKAVRDVGISAFAVRRFPLDKTRSELLIELHNLSLVPESMELRLDGDDRPIEVLRVELSAGERKRWVFDNITGVDRTLRASLRRVDGGHDDLPANDRAYATLPERTRSRVLCVTEGNRYLEAALLLDEYLQVDVVAPANYTPTRAHDVVIFDRHVPAQAPTQPAIYLAPEDKPARPGPLRITGVMERPYFDRLERDHPLLRHVALGDVNIASASLVELNRDDRAIGSDVRGPLLIEGRREGIPFVALTFDVTASDLPLRVAWPMLLLNALDGFASQQVGYIESYRAGEPGVLALQMPDQAPTWSGTEGGTHALAVSDGKVTIDATRAGFYTLQDGSHARTVAINAAPIDGIAPHALSRTVHSPHASPTATGVHELPWRWLLLAAVVLLAIEWLTFHRRWTV